MIPEWIDSALAAGLAADALELHLQPIVHLDDGWLYGAESFIRWRDREHGRIPASDAVFDEGPLTHPSIDLVKLDRSLLDADPVWLEGVVGRVHDAGKTSLLEGIETAEHQMKAIDAGVVLGQGFLYAPPLRLDRFEAFGRSGAG